MGCIIRWAVSRAWAELTSIWIVLCDAGLRVCSGQYTVEVLFYTTESRP